MSSSKLVLERLLGEAHEQVTALDRASAADAARVSAGADDLWRAVERVDRFASLFVVQTASARAARAKLRLGGSCERERERERGVAGDERLGVPVRARQPRAAARRRGPRAHRVGDELRSRAVGARRHELRDAGAYRGGSAARASARARARRRRRAAARRARARHYELRRGTARGAIAPCGSAARARAAWAMPRLLREP
jgi:hypothetical protein